MKTLLLSILPLVAMWSSPAQALINHTEQRALVDLLNQSAISNTLQATQVRCSIGNKLCLVRFQVNEDQRSIACLVGGLQDRSDIFLNADEAQGLSHYFQNSLGHCLKELI